MKKIIGIACLVTAFCFIMTMAASAEEKQSVGKKVQNFGQKLVNYPANVTKDSVGVVTETSKKSTDVVTKEVKTTGKVLTGEVDKSKEMVTEPLTGTAQTAVDTVKDTANIPVKAAQEE